MKLTQILGFGAVTAIAACGGGGKSGGTTTEDKVVETKPDVEAWYASCGLETTRDMQDLMAKPEEELTDEDYDRMGRDPASQTPKDVDACLEFVRWTMANTEEPIEIVAASDIGYALCFGETNSGEGCYWHSFFWQRAIWIGNGDEYTPSTVTMWMSEGCNAGYQPACDILETHKDPEGRDWNIEASPEGEGEGEEYDDEASGFDGP